MGCTQITSRRAKNKSNDHTKNNTDLNINNKDLSQQHLKVKETTTITNKKNVEQNPNGQNNNNKLAETIRASVLLKNQNDNIKIKIKTEENEPFELQVSQNANINDVINEINNGSKEKISSNDVRINNQNFPSSVLLQSMFPKNSNQMEFDINIEIKSPLKHLSKTSQKYLSSKNQMLGKIIDSDKGLCLLTFYRKTHDFSTYYIKDENILSSTKISYFSKLSALCNGCNILYISGGENDSYIPLKHFWKIDLTNQKITLHSKGMPYSNKTHSMIFIPESYVFIIGGNTQSVCYYDEYSDSFEQWIPLDEIVYEPALAYVNDCFLFVFANIVKTNENALQFHRTNLKETPHWEIIKPVIEDDNMIVNQKFFASCYDNKSGEIIFFGGNKFEIDKEISSDEKFCFAYNWNENKIVNSNIQFIGCNIDEKVFIPFNNKYSYLLPSFGVKDIKLVNYNNEKRVFNIINFFKANKSSIVKSVSKDESESNNMNNLSYNLGQPNFENVVKKVPLMTSDIQESSYLRNKSKKGKYFFNMPTLNSNRNKGIIEHIREDTKENEDASQMQSGMFQEQQAQPKTFNELGNGTMLFSLDQRLKNSSINEYETFREESPKNGSLFKSNRTNPFESNIPEENEEINNSQNIMNASEVNHNNNDINIDNNNNNNDDEQRSPSNIEKQERVSNLNLDLNNLRNEKTYINTPQGKFSNRGQNNTNNNKKENKKHNIYKSAMEVPNNNKMPETILNNELPPLNNNIQLKGSSINFGKLNLNNN